MTTDTTEFAAVHDELRAVARELLGGDRPDVDWRLLGDAGWLGLEVPAAQDGADATFAEVAVVLEELGRAASRTPYLGAVVLGVGTLNLLEPGPGRDETLRSIAAGAAVVATALVDGADDDLGDAVPFRLERTGAGLRLHGRAGYVPDAADADRLLLLALDPAGTPVVVSLDPPTARLDVEAQELLDATRRFGVVRADGVEVPAEAVLRFDGEPRAAVRRLLDRAAVALACDSLGLSEAMLAATVDHARTREQFGRPIGSFQAVKHACADMLVQVTVSRQLVIGAVRHLAGDPAGDPAADPAADQAGDQGEGTVAASMAKSYACTAAVDVAGTAMQLHGGMGYTWESGIHAYLKRAALSRSLFGSPIAHRRRLARRYRPA